jgi:GMP synthase (glutamine-hydrolysing)
VRALAIVNQRDAGPGVFAEALQAGGVDLETWLVPERDRPAGDVAGYDAVLVLGGAMHVDHEDRHPWLRAEKQLLAELLDREVPTLAVCLGAQLLAEAAGAAPRRAREPEIGWHAVHLTDAGRADPLVAGMAPGFEAFQWHSYEFPLPPGATALAYSDVCLQAFRAGPCAWGIQFHAEVSAADASAWIRDYRSDEDAVRIGLNPEALLDQTQRSIGAWNETGRALCTRFIEQVAVRASL